MDLVATVYWVLYSRLTVEIRQNHIVLRPNTQSNRTSLLPNVLDEIYVRFFNYTNQNRYNPLCGKMTKLVNFIEDISDYLLDWKNNLVELQQYIDLRKADIPERIKEISPLYPDVKRDIDLDPTLTVGTQLEEIFLTIERNIVKDILEKYVPKLNH